MRTTIVLLAFVVVCSSMDGQNPSKQAAKSAVSVYVTHAGQDTTGTQFVEAVKRVLSKSGTYGLGNPNASAYERGFRLYVDISTLDLGSAGDLAEHTSVASVVVQEMGLPNSWPVPFMWYHKVFLVKANRLDELAQQFVADMDAHWCNTSKSSIGNCPKESIPPIYPISTPSVAPGVRYFRADHGVGATYVRLGADGRYEVIDREHMGVFLKDEGRWLQIGAVITFSSKNPKRPSYQATENKHNSKTFLAITSEDAAIGIVIPAEDTNKDLDNAPNDLPDHVLFRISAKTYNTETKENYPFRYIGKEH